MEDLKILWGDIKKSPAILITLIFVVIVVIYWVYSQNNSTSSTGSTSNTSGTQPVELDNISVTPPASSGTTGGTNTGPATSPKAVKITKSGSLESTPHDISGGSNILNVPQGATVNVISGPIKDPLGSNKNYWYVSYNNQMGYIGSDTGSYS